MEGSHLPNKTWFFPKAGHGSEAAASRPALDGHAAVTDQPRLLGFLPGCPLSRRSNLLDSRGLNLGAESQRGLQANTATLLKNPLDSEAVVDRPVPHTGDGLVPEPGGVT